MKVENNFSKLAQRPVHLVIKPASADTPEDTKADGRRRWLPLLAERSGQPTRSGCGH